MTGSWEIPQPTPPGSAGRVPPSWLSSSSYFVLSHRRAMELAGVRAVKRWRRQRVTSVSQGWRIEDTGRRTRR